MSTSSKSLKYDKHNDASIDSAFTNALKMVEERKHQQQSSQAIDQNTQLQLYGLFKIATEGDCKESGPWMNPLNPAPYYKWKAWNSLNGMKPSKAKREYVDLLKSVLQNE